MLAITLVATHARAHVAPSVDDNNRYLKVTPAADRVRIAYTVFFGEVPGAQMRRTIDANRDGQISDAEAQRFADRIAGEVAAGLDVSIDGTPAKVGWSTVSAGMGTPSTSGGAFSIDLIAWACLPSARGTHTVQLRDRFRISRPGETEVKVDDGLGITIHHARVGRADDATHDYRFVGPGGPLTDDGLDLSFTATDKAPLTDDATCAGVEHGRASLGQVLGVLASLTVALAALYVLGRNHSSR
ncbi:MAG: hypothetical protein SFX73_39805 [Kofleriaceae bacterium]|nr:hypothetical protein [Kofleriaceae bacterium]